MWSGLRESTSWETHILEIGKPKHKQAPILRDGEVVAFLSVSNWTERATLTRGEWAYNLGSRRRRRLIGSLRTDPEPPDTGEQARFFAAQRSMWLGIWDLNLEGVLYTMSSPSSWRATRRIERNGQEVGVTGTTSWWLGPHPTLNAAYDVPLDHQLFMLWMAFVLQRRAAKRASSAGSTA